jgi:hypothetical protein
MSIAPAGPTGVAARSPATPGPSVAEPKVPLQTFGATLQGTSAAQGAPQPPQPPGPPQADSTVSQAPPDGDIVPSPVVQSPTPPASALTDRTARSPTAADSAMDPADGSAPARPRRDARRDEDALDPMARHAAQLAAPPSLGALLSSPAAAAMSANDPLQRARASLEEVLPALVRRVAWSGDGRRGTMRLEIGQGRLAGATLLVHADDGRVRVELSAPAGVDASSWRERILSRLHVRGVRVDSVEVD